MVARLITGIVAEDDEFTQAVRISGTLAYIALLSQSVVHPIVQASLIANVRNGIAAQLGTIANKVRKISRSEFSRSNIEDSYNASKTSGQRNVEDSLNARKISRSEFSESKIEDSYHARETSSNELCKDSYAEKGAIANSTSLENEPFGCTSSAVNSSFFVMKNWDEGNSEGSNCNMDSALPGNSHHSDRGHREGDGHDTATHSNMDSTLPGNSHHSDRGQREGDGQDTATHSNCNMDSTLPGNSHHSDKGHREGDGQDTATHSNCNMDSTLPGNSHHSDRQREGDGHDTATDCSLQIDEQEGCEGALASGYERNEMIN